MLPGIPYPPATIGGNTVLGRLATGAGPVEQIPFASLAAQITLSNTTVGTMALLRALVPTSTSTTIYLLGFNSEADGGEGLFWWSGSSTATDDGGTIIQPNAGGTGRWIRFFAGSFAMPEWFGAVGNFNPSTGTGNDDRAALQSWLNYGAGQANGCKLKGRPGANYFLNSYTDSSVPAMLILGSRTQTNAANAITFDMGGATIYPGQTGTALLIANSNNVRGNLRILGYAGGTLGSGRQYDSLVCVCLNSMNISLDDDFYLDNCLGFTFLVVGDPTIAGGGIGLTPKNVTLGKGIIKERYGNGTRSSSGGSQTQSAVAIIDCEGFTKSPDCVIYGGVDCETNQIDETVTITEATPAVLTFASSTYIGNGHLVYFTTNGSLPNGLSTGTPYYCVNTSGKTCNVAATYGGTPINTTSAGSGTHTGFWPQRLIDINISGKFRSGFVTPISTLTTSNYWTPESIGLYNNGGTVIPQSVSFSSIASYNYGHGNSIHDCDFEQGTITIEGANGSAILSGNVASVKNNNFSSGKIIVGPYNSSFAYAYGLAIENNTCFQTTDASNAFILVETALYNCSLKNNVMTCQTSNNNLPVIAVDGVHGSDGGNNIFANNYSAGSTSVAVSMGTRASTSYYADNLAGAAGITVPTIFHTGGIGAYVGTMGNNTTPGTTTTYVAEVFIGNACTLTGIALLNGGSAAGNIQMALANGAGYVLGSTASTAQSGTNAYQQVPFTSVVAIDTPGRYYVMVQFSSASARFQSHVVGNFFTTTVTGGTYGTFVSPIATLPTGFTTDVGPIADTY